MSAGLWRGWLCFYGRRVSLIWEGSDMERKGELLHYNFLTYIRQNDLKFTVWLLEPRNLKLNANCIVTDQGKATLSCLAKWEEGGITLSSFLTLKSSDVSPGRNLRDHPSDPALLFYASESEIQEKFDDLSYLSEWVSEWVIIAQLCLFTTPWTVACQAPLSMEFSRQEYWSGLPFPCTEVLACTEVFSSVLSKALDKHDWGPTSSDL